MTDISVITCYIFWHSNVGDNFSRFLPLIDQLFIFQLLCNIRSSSQIHHCFKHEKVTQDGEERMSFLKFPFTSLKV